MRRWKQAFVFAWLSWPAPALAWGPQGHEIVAHLAAMNLTPKAKAQVAALLGGEAEAAMVIAANWADEIRDDRPQTARWHYVNLEIDGDLRYQAPRDCPGGDCAVAQIARDTAILQSRASPASKAEALKFLIHLVGDIHQPLHAADRHDRGGNAVQVTLEHGRPVTLHHFWDDNVVAAWGRDPRAIASTFDASFRNTRVTGGSPADWAQTSAFIARDVVYPQLGNNGKLSDIDLGHDAIIARARLSRAGYELAKILNGVFR